MHTGHGRIVVEAQFGAAATAKDRVEEMEGLALLAEMCGQTRRRQGVWRAFAGTLRSSLDPIDNYMTNSVLNDYTVN